MRPEPVILKTCLLGLLALFVWAVPALAQTHPAALAIYTDDPTDRVRVDASSAAARGPADAPITIVIFAEFEDPFIARAQAALERVRETYGQDVRFVFRHRPLPFHTHSRDAARAALEALRQGGASQFFAMHDLMLSSQRQLAPGDLVGYARALGLDAREMRQALTDGRHDATIAADEAEADLIGATGSPIFFINGVRLSGAQPFESFQRVIDAELGLAGRAALQGAGRGDIYAIAMAAADARTRAASAAPPAATPPPVEPVFRVPVHATHPSLGPSDALVTIVMFMDLQGPFCARVQPTLLLIRQRYGADLRLVFRHNPLAFHQTAMPAAEAATEAMAQGGNQKFWEMHDLLYANQRSQSAADLERYAAQIGLDVARFRRAMSNRIHRARVEADLAFGQSIGVRGVPNFMINGRRLVGARAPALFVEKIDAALHEARAAVQNGVPRGRVYAHLTNGGLTAAPPVPAPTHTARWAPRRPDPAAIYRVPVTRAQPSRGRRDALVTIVVWGDFQSPYTRQLQTTLAGLERRYGRELRIVARQNPLSLHANARRAAEAALEAYAQGAAPKYWRMHALLLEHQDDLTRTVVEGLASQIGLDMVRFRRALDQHTHEPTIAADQALAVQLGATGAPTSFVNGRQVRGAQPSGAFAHVIDEELARARVLRRRGVPRRRIYARAIANGATAPVLITAP